MELTVQVVGGDTHQLFIVDGTYADVLRAVNFHPQEATVLVDGRPVPDDAEITHTDVQVLRLIAGG